MAITISKRILSGSTHGQAISVSSTQGGTNAVIHALSTSATGTVDEIYLYAQNNFSQAAEITFEIGASTTQSHVVAVVAARSGPALVFPGLPLTGSACSITAFVGYPGGSGGSPIASAGLVSVFGYVNRIVQS